MNPKISFNISIFITLLFFLTACSSNVRFSSDSSGINYKKTDRKYREGDILKGESSYYADKFHGRKTANGEVYNMHDLTAAHKYLPFNTILRVKNTANDKTVNVRINDRGPFKKNRILDLSLGAAKKIDLIKSGTTTIEAKIVKLGK